MRYLMSHFPINVIFMMVCLCSCEMIKAESICFKKPGFPGSDFEAAVSYELLSHDRLRLSVFVDGIEGDYNAELELYYDVPDDFIWSLEEFYNGRYSLTSMVALEEDDGQIEADVYLKRSFPDLALHLSLLPVGDGKTAFCQQDFYIRVNRDDINFKSKKGILGYLKPLSKT